MKYKDYKIDICNLNAVLIGCVNENLLSVSFDYIGNLMKLKLVFKEYTEVERDIEDDIIADFCALSGYFDYDFLKDYPITFVGKEEQSLKYKVYLSSECADFQNSC